LVFVDVRVVDADGPRRATVGRHPDGVLVVADRVDDHGQTLVVEVERARSPEQAVPRPHTPVTVDLDPDHGHTAAVTALLWHRVVWLIATEASSHGASGARRRLWFAGGTSMTQQTTDFDIHAVATGAGVEHDRG
jgi:hypothetical protein